MPVKDKHKPAQRTLSEKMQKRVLAVILKDARKFAQCRSFITPDLFTDTALSDVYSAAQNVWDTHHEIPSRTALTDLFSDNEPARIKIRELYKLVVHDEKYTIDRIAKFANNRAVKLACLHIGAVAKYNETHDITHLENYQLVDSRGNIKKGYEDPLAILQRAVSVGSSAANTGVFFDEIMENIARRARHPADRNLLYTGYKHLDESGTGIARGEIGCVLGSSKSGKSHFLLGIAMKALHEGLNVMYVNVEIEEERLEDRFGRRIAGKKADMHKDPEDFVKRMMDNYRKRVINGARLKLVRRYSGEVSMNDVRALVIQCHAEGFKPDVLVIDYVGIMRPDVVRTEERHNINSLWVQFRGLCQEFNVYGWSAAQANRIGARSDLVRGEDLAECYQIKSHIDLGISITRTLDEIEESKGRFHIFASRNGRDGLTVNFTEDFSRSLFVTEGISDSKADTTKAKKQRPATTDEQRSDAQLNAAVAKRNGKPDVCGPGA